MPEDYILRLIEQIAALLAGILAKLNGGQYPAARLEIEHLCLSQIGLGIGDVKRRSPESLSDHLAQSGQLQTQRSVLLAELLLLDAQLGDRDANSAAAIVGRMHAFCLLRDAELGDLVHFRAVYRAKMDEITKLLRPFANDPRFGSGLAHSK